MDDIGSEALNMLRVLKVDHIVGVLCIRLLASNLRYFLIILR